MTKSSRVQHDQDVLLLQAFPHRRGANCSAGLREPQHQGSQCWLNGIAAVLAPWGEVQVSGCPLPPGFSISNVHPWGAWEQVPHTHWQGSLTLTPLAVKGLTASYLPGGQRWVPDFSVDLVNLYKTSFWKSWRFSWTTRDWQDSQELSAPLGLPGSEGSCCGNMVSSSHHPLSWLPLSVHLSRSYCSKCVLSKNSCHFLSTCEVPSVSYLLSHLNLTTSLWGRDHSHPQFPDEITEGE